jgi:hypothetical protein
VSAIVVRVSAAADASLRNVFKPLETAAAQAEAKVSGSAKRSRKTAGAEAAASAKEQAKALADVYRQMPAVLAKSASDSAKHRAQEVRAAERNAKIIERIKYNSLLNQQRAEESAARQSASRMRQHESESRRSRFVFARDFGRDSVHNMGRMGRAAIGGVSEIGRGMGMETSVGGLTKRVVDTESAAIRATLSGFAAINAKRRNEGLSVIQPTKADIAATLAGIRSSGDATSTDYGGMAEGLEAFVSKSSDLKGGLSSLTMIGQIAKASGVNFRELADAAGDISATMGDLPAAEKAQKLGAALRIIATQGAMGTVEIKDLATYMARLAAPASTLSGDYNKNLAEVGTLAQMSKFAGRSTAAEQTNSASQFVNDITNKQSLKRMKGAGINVFDDQGRVRSVRDLILATYAKTGGDVGKISSLFINKNSAAAVKGFLDVYRDAGGGEKGLAAINATFDKFSKSMSAEDVDNAAKIAKESKSGKAQDLQNRFETSWANAMEKLVPALERATPQLVKLADALSKAVVWAAENPGRAITYAIVASIAKAGVTTAVSAALARAITGASVPGVPGSGGGGKGRPGGVGSGVGPGLASTFAIIGVGAAADQYAKYLDDDEVFRRDQKGEEADALKNAERQGKTTAEIEKGGKRFEVFRGGGGKVESRELGREWVETERGGHWEESKDGKIKQHAAAFGYQLKLLKERRQAEAIRAAKANGDTGAFGTRFTDSVDENGVPNEAIRSGSGNGSEIAALRAQMAATTEAVIALKSGVRVTNLSDIKIPGGTRVGPDGTPK